MTKRKKKVSGLVFVAISAVFALASICMIFLPAFVNDTVGTSFTGIQTAFGYSEDVFIGNAKILDMNILSLIAFALPLLALIISLVAYKNKKVCLICAITYFVSAICSFVAVLTFPSTVVGASLLTLDWAMGIGTILCGVFSAVAGIVLTYRAIKK